MLSFGISDLANFDEEALHVFLDPRDGGVDSEDLGRALQGSDATFAARVAAALDDRASRRFRVRGCFHVLNFGAPVCQSDSPRRYEERRTTHISMVCPSWRRCALFRKSWLQRYRRSGCTLRTGLLDRCRLVKLD